MLLPAVKIGLGSSIAIYIAQMLHLEYAVLRGMVTLLTLLRKNTLHDAQNCVILMAKRKVRVSCGKYS